MSELSSTTWAKAALAVFALTVAFAVAEPCAEAARPVRAMPLSYWAPRGDGLADSTTLRGVPEHSKGTVSVCWHDLPAGVVVRVVAKQAGAPWNRTGTAFVVEEADTDVGEFAAKVRFPTRDDDGPTAYVVEARVWYPARQMPATDAKPGIFLCGSTAKRGL